jgi:hypothetical protein
VGEEHVAEGEGDEGDVGIVVVEVEIERDLRLEEFRADAVMKKDGAVPGAAEKGALQRADLPIVYAAQKCFCHGRSFYGELRAPELRGQFARDSITSFVDFRANGRIAFCA